MIYPQINGVRYDWSSLELAIAGTTGTAYLLVGCKELSYSDKLEPGLVRGTSAQVLARTRGEYDAEGSFTIYKSEWVELLPIITQNGTIGYLEAVWNLTVHYNEPALGVVTDQLIGVRIKNNENSHSQGSDPLVKKLDFHIMKLIESGYAPLTNQR